MDNMQLANVEFLAYCPLPIVGPLQLYHNYKVVATNFLQKDQGAKCIKTVHSLYR